MLRPRVGIPGVQLSRLVVLSHSCRSSILSFVHARGARQLLAVQRRAERRPALTPAAARAPNVTLVTGAAGFAGSHLLDLLTADGTPIVAWHRPGGTRAPRESTATWEAVDLLNKAA